MKFFFIATLFAVTSMGAADAAEWKAGSITIENPYARATAGKATAGGGYLSIHNHGQADKLIAASSDVAAMTQLHTHIHEGNVMKMRPVEAIDVPENGGVELKPGGYHVMFMKLKGPLKEGQHFPLELTFEKAGKVTVEVAVGGVGAKMAPEMDHSKMDHMKMDPAKMEKSKN